MIIFLIPYYHTGKTFSKQFQLWFPAHHKKLIKLNKDQSIIIKKFRTIFQKKSYQGMLWFRCLSDTTGVIPKLIGVKLRKSPGNINYSKFPPGWTDNKICGDRKLKLFSAGSCFKGQIFTGKISGVDSAGTLRQGV